MDIKQPFYRNTNTNCFDQRFCSTVKLMIYQLSLFGGKTTCCTHMQLGRFEYQCLQSFNINLSIAICPMKSKYKLFQKRHQCKWLFDHKQSLHWLWDSSDIAAIICKNVHTYQLCTIYSGVCAILAFPQLFFSFLLLILINWSFSCLIASQNQLVLHLSLTILWPFPLPRILLL